jgi:octaprenyl-diphosphate synthase
MRGVIDTPKALEPLGLLLADQLELVSTCFETQLHSPLVPVAQLVKHIERYRGKMLRPTLVLLSGLAANEPPPGSEHATTGGALTGDHTIAAAVCEMVHMATLVHDDVLDEAEVRRRGATVNNLYGNEPAVILGDYLFAGAYHLCSQIKDAPTARQAALQVGQASMATCAGELMQLHHRHDFALTQDRYYEIVAGKTGELIGASCHLGALVSRAPAPVLGALTTFGKTLGVAFQIQDDLLDLLGSEASVGKSVHKDVALGKLTLPVIHHLAKAAPAVRDRSLKALKNAASGSPEPSSSADLIRSLHETHSITFAADRARTLVQDAIASLTPVPDSPARHMLTMLANAVVDRTH